MKDYVIYKEFMHRSGMPEEVIGSREFVQVLSNTTEEQMFNICRRLNMTCKHTGINRHYGFYELEEYDGCFDNA